MRAFFLSLFLFPVILFSQEVTIGPAVQYKYKTGLFFNMVGIDEDHIVVSSYIQGATKVMIYVFDRNLNLLREGEIEGGYFWKGKSSYNVSKQLMLNGDQIVAFYGNRVGSSAYFYYDVFNLTTLETISSENVIIKYDYPALVLAQAIEVKVSESANGWIADISLFGKLGGPGTTKHRIAKISSDLSFELTDEFLHENTMTEGWLTQYGRTDENGNTIFLTDHVQDGKLMYVVISDKGYVEKKFFDYGSKKLDYALKELNNKIWTAGIYSNDKSNYNERKYDGIFIFSEEMSSPILLPFSELNVTPDFNEAMDMALSLEPLIDLAEDGENLYLIVSNNIRKKGGRMLVVKYHLTTGDLSSQVISAESNKFFEPYFADFDDGKLRILLSVYDYSAVTYGNLDFENNLIYYNVQGNDLSSFDKSAVDLSKLTDDEYHNLNFRDNIGEYSDDNDMQITFLIGKKNFRLISFGD